MSTPDLSGLKRVTTADVYKARHLAGTLERNAQGGVAFAYQPGYDGPPVASTLPVTDAAVTAPGGGLPTFFSGLLPEGHRLSVLRSAAKTSLDD